MAEKSGESLDLAVQKITDELAIGDGKLVINVHDNKITWVEICLKLSFNSEHDSVERLSDEMQGRLKQVKRAIRRKGYEKAVVEKVEGYGAIEVVVKNRIVKIWNATEKHKAVRIKA